MIYRLIRGENADYADEEFTDEQQRDAAARGYAKQDQQEVLLEYLDEATGQWWCTGAAYPPGQEPEPVNQATRFSATAIMPGDGVTVFGAPAGQFGQVSNEDHSGTVVRKHKVESLWFGIDGWRIELEDGRVIDCIDHAVATIHFLGYDQALESL